MTRQELLDLKQRRKDFDWKDVDGSVVDKLLNEIDNLFWLCDHWVPRPDDGYGGISLHPDGTRTSFSKPSSRPYAPLDLPSDSPSAKIILPENFSDNLRKYLDAQS